MFGLSYGEDSEYDNSSLFPKRKEKVINGITVETITAEDGTVRTIYKIPIGSRKKWWQFWKKDSEKKAKEELSKLISDYKEDVKFDDKSGEILLPPTEMQIPVDYFFTPQKNNDDLNEQK